ncbi:hypothetical protein [Maribacter stanieri]|uniref:Uncharacterized protein n=1 Tax=Maribacter stanieri TaxID=440514 RepID=A0A1I6I732_9FLAO|nr:hypothetical protein [Maribacter stanieri]SFR62542.1 hypothetical protein SAMN04488010_1230 [Maribacter stanieri]
MRQYINNILLLTMIFGLLISCEQERLDPVLTTAEGGGTLDNYIAYSVISTDPMGSNVYGRIVFYETTLDQTLVQLSLYNTIDGEMHPALIVDGAADMGSTTIIALDDVSGSTGEFMTNKFFVITDTDFYDSIMTLDAHVSISLSPSDDTIVATGDLGINADPVETN